MKPELSEILIPASKLHSSPSTESTTSYVRKEKSDSTMNKCFISAAIVFAFVVAIVTTAFIVRYEDKLSQYEDRISSLEKELSGIYEMWEEEYGPLHVSEKDFEYEIPTHPGLFGSEENPEESESASKEEEQAASKKEEHKKASPAEDKSVSRKKRQIPFNPVPTYGPEVERTADGVPILESSYLDRTTELRPAAAFFARFEQPTTESEGLRLYEGLLATGGRNEPRSLDHSGVGNGILPHHRTSAAWSQKSEKRHTRRTSSNIQLKSGDSQSSTSSGFGESTGPQFSEEYVYRRSSSGNRGRNCATATGTGGRRCQPAASTVITRSSDGQSQSNLCGLRCQAASGTATSTGNQVRSCGNRCQSSTSLRSGDTGVSASGSSSGGSSSHSEQTSSSSSSNYHRRSTSSFQSSGTPTVTYHRSSRVPATADFLLPSQSQASVRSLQYPPLQTLGRGDGEVIARVLQTDSDHDSEFANGASASGSESSTNSEAHQQGSRRVSGSRRSSSYNQGRKIHGRNNSNSRLGDISIVKAEAWIETPGKPVAAHYVADVSNFTTSHRHYEGNGRLRNADGVFAAWKPSDWMAKSTKDEEKNFVLNQNGVLTIKKPGIYYIYAQIHYLDEHDINGYVVQVNTTPFLQCTTMTETRSGGSKSNSCFTAGITQLKENDRILVRDIETNRYSIFKPEKSFFGLMRIGEIN